MIRCQHCFSLSQSYTLVILILTEVTTNLTFLFIAKGNSFLFLYMRWKICKRGKRKKKLSCPDNKVWSRFSLFSYQQLLLVKLLYDSSIGNTGYYIVIFTATIVTFTIIFENKLNMCLRIQRLCWLIQLIIMVKLNEIYTNLYYWNKLFFHIILGRDNLC